MSSRSKVALIILIAALFAATSAFSSEERMEYKRFNPEEVSCYTAVKYNFSGDKLRVAVSAITCGKDSRPARWAVSGININIAGRSIKPNTSAEFFTRRESITGFPAAVAFEALSRTPSTGLLVKRSEGDLSGLRHTFYLDTGTMEKIDEGRDFIEITLEDAKSSLKKTLKISLKKPPFEEERFVYDAMSPEDLTKIIDALSAQEAVLEKNLANYRRDADPEYEEVERKIEDIQAERALAYLARESRK